MTGGEHLQQRTQEPPQMVEDETEVVASAAQQGVDGVADCAGKEVTIEPAVVLHVTDHGFDGAAPSELTSHRWRQATRR